MGREDRGGGRRCQWGCLSSVRLRELRVNAALCGAGKEGLRPDKLGVFWYSAGVSGDGKGPIQYSIPSANFAKLVVWSFLAGFAERFLPDQLSVLESQAKKAS